MRRRLPAYPLPILRLARFGVDRRAQGLGAGRALLRHVLALALDPRDSFGCIGVVTDAKPEAVAFYRVTVSSHSKDSAKARSMAIRSPCSCI